MVCNQDIIMQYHSGELDKQTSEEIQHHLKRCDVCTGWFAELLEMEQDFGLLPELKAGNDLTDRIVERYRMQRVAPWWKYPIPVWAATCAAAFCALFVWNINHNFPPDKEVQTQMIVRRSAPPQSLVADIRRLNSKVQAVYRVESSMEGVRGFSPTDSDIHKRISRLKGSLAGFDKDHAQGRFQMKKAQQRSRRSFI